MSRWPSVGLKYNLHAVDARTDKPLNVRLFLPRAKSHNMQNLIPLALTWPTHSRSPLSIEATGIMMVICFFFPALQIRFDSKRYCPNWRNIVLASGSQRPKAMTTAPKRHLTRNANGLVFMPFTLTCLMKSK